MKKFFIYLAIVLVFFVGETRASALDITLSSSWDTTFQVEQEIFSGNYPVDLYPIFFDFTNNTSDLIEVTISSSGFSSYGVGLYAKPSDTFLASFWIDGNQTVSKSVWEYGAGVLDSDGLHWVPAEVGDWDVVFSLFIDGFIDGEAFHKTWTVLNFGAESLFTVKVVDVSGSPVPEPGTFLLLSLGLLGLSGFSRMKT